MTDHLIQTSYPWYESVEEDTLEQGDLLDRCRIFIPRYTLADLAGENLSIGQIENDAQFHDVVIINQTCDLPGLNLDVQIVDLAKVFILPYDIMKQFARSKGERIRLRSPYKEKLAQAFAYYYMRVALPIDLEEFDIVNQVQVITKPAS